MELSSIKYLINYDGVFGAAPDKAVRVLKCKYKVVGREGLSTGAKLLLKNWTGSNIFVWQK